jgi:hypothetical protein
LAWLAVARGVSRLYATRAQTLRDVLSHQHSSLLRHDENASATYVTPILGAAQRSAIYSVQIDGRRSIGFLARSLSGWAATDHHGSLS